MALSSPDFILAKIERVQFTLFLLRRSNVKCVGCAELRGLGSGIVILIIVLLLNKLFKWGSGQPDLEIWGARSPKRFFWPFGPQFGLRMGVGGGVAPWAPPLDSPVRLCLHCQLCQLLRSAVLITNQFCPHSVLLLAFLSNKAVRCCCCYFPC